jgi:hypothetical protein
MADNGRATILQAIDLVQHYFWRGAKTRFSLHALRGFAGPLTVSGFALATSPPFHGGEESLRHRR